MSQYPLPLTLPPVYSADNFVVSDNNRDAFRWINAWPDWPAHALLLHGPHGAGKSHLGHLWAERAGASILPAGTLGNDLPDASKNWLVEDIDRLEEERPLLHLFNAIRENGGHLLLTSAVPPETLPFHLPDLTSRLLALPRAEILEADDAALAAAMRKQFTDRQMRVDDEVIAWLLPRMERSLGQVAELVARLDEKALAERKPITVPFVRRLLEDTEQKLLFAD